jgi:hypothetical protein
MRKRGKRYATFANPAPYSEIRERRTGRGFYFKGPDQVLNLRAYNLSIFIQLADGVDDATWMHHLEAHDYPRWLKVAIKDDELSDAVRDIEGGSEEDARAPN